MPKSTALHILKLIYRGALLIVAAVFPAARRIELQRLPDPLFLLIWAVYMAEMLRRLFPIRTESIGCQKQFAHTFRPAGRGGEKPALPNSRALVVAAIWAVFNAGIGCAYFRGRIGRGALVLLSLAFAVCDMICVLVFCPFQKWIMKNRCCITCRIYDWDYAMMFTPLCFIPSFWTWSLFGMGLVLLARWEVAASRHPERFSDVTNASLSCKVCTEKLCRHKKL